jgi:hypothetical protein
MKEKVVLQHKAGATFEQTVVANLVSYVLEHHREIKSNGLYAEVEFIINGHPVSFAEVAVAFAGAHEQHVKQMAVELLTGDAALAGLRAALLSAAMAVREAVNKLPKPEEKEEVAMKR